MKTEPDESSDDEMLDSIKMDCIFVRGRGWVQKDDLDDLDEEAQVEPQEVRWGKSRKKRKSRDDYEQD